MPKTDHHAAPFDESTKLKLSLYETYLKEWLGVFIHRAGVVNIFDFHCGPGTDITGVKGSPLRCLDIICDYSELINKNKVNICVYFSDKDLSKIHDLRLRLSNMAQLPRTVRIYVEALEFNDSFARLYDIMSRQGSANFLFIDPTGLAVNHEIFKKIFALKRTDFLLFTPSSFCLRFRELPSSLLSG